MAANPYSNLFDDLAESLAASAKRAALVNTKALAKTVANMQPSFEQGAKLAVEAAREASRSALFAYWAAQKSGVPQLYGYTILYRDKNPEVIYAVEYERRVILGRETHCFRSDAGGSWMLRSGDVQSITRDRWPAR